ncbi:MAG: mechanosensitive ion channel domain-containing protein [Chitinophagaceae bacterium]
MKISLKCILVIAVQIVFTVGVSAQSDIIEKKADSLNAINLQDYNLKLVELNQQKIADSIYKAKLEKELGSLKDTDRQRKEELEKEIQEIKKKDAAIIAQKKARIDSLRQNVKGHPVEGFFNDTLFFIYNRSGGFTAKDRALAIGERIKIAGKKLKFNTDSIRLVEGESNIDILFNETVLMSISENDALWNNLSKQELAQKNLEIINAAIKKYKSETSVAVLAKEIGLALLVILIACSLIYFVNKLFRFITKKIGQQEGIMLKGIKIRDYTLFNPQREVMLLISLLSFLKWGIIILLVYLALPIIFGLFPWTENYATTLFGYVLSPVKKIGLGVWHYLPNLITIFVIVLIFRFVLRFLYFLRTEIEKGNLKLSGFYPDWANPTYQIFRILTIAFMLIVIFPYLPGSNSPVFKGVSVFLGFLFTFGSAGSLSNVISGLVLTYMRLFKIGDRVKIGEITGDIIERSLLVTRIRTTKNEIISIPNSTVMSSPSTNYSSDAPEKGLVVYSTVTIGYDVPWRDMHQALIDAALRCESILKDPSPFVLQTSLDDFFVSYQVNAFTREPNKQAAIYSLLHQHIQDVCNERGIEIMSPHYRSGRDGNKSTIPESYLPKDYKTPTFKMSIKNEPENPL